MLTSPPFILRAMTLTDLTAVRAIDRLSFLTPARSGLFEHELENTLAYYQVLVVRRDGQKDEIIGFAGYWLIADEIHVSSIAIHPQWRRRGLGELLFLNLLFLSYDHPANMVTLEVRRSNVTAQALYRKYLFEEVGIRPHYYRDTGENALLMTMASLNARYHHFLEKKQAHLFPQLRREV